MLARPDPFALLERPDKWYLGGGQAAIFAPAFPKYLDTPGFWDEAYFADIRLERLFCLLLLDAQGRPITLQRVARRWTPDCLTQIYIVAGLPALQIQEQRVVTPNDTLACRLTVTNAGPSPVRLHLMLWSLQTQRSLPPDALAATVAAVEREPDALSFAHCVRCDQPGNTPADVYGWGERTPGVQANVQPEPWNASDSCSLFVALGASRLPDSWTVNLAETTDTAPLWELSVFPEKFRNGTLPRAMQAEAGWNQDGLLHMALHYVIEPLPNEPETVTFGANLALSREAALARLRADMSEDVVARSRQNWADYFASVPYFACSDPYLERAYWYRWYGLRLNTINVGLPCPCVFEGIGAFRSHIAYSAPAHIRETVWMRETTLAMGCLENFLANQVLDANSPEDGFLPGHLYLWRSSRGFYHADWGTAAQMIYDRAGNDDFVRRVYPGLARYAAYFDRERDREQSGLYDVIDQGETGQEYMSRYLFADENADTWRRFQIKGVDATCYLYRLHRVLAEFATRLKLPAEAARWTQKAEKTRAAIRERMWDERDRLFKDVHPQTGARSPHKAAVGFYPFLYDLADQTHLPALYDHLNNPQTFGTPFPVPASSVDDPNFSAEAEWKGKRTNCPWNGRVWPMTTSHVAEALCHAARTLDSELRPAAAELIHRFVRMLFHNGDPKRPNCYEHYNPYTGTPSLYRGVDDYQHSWLIHLILSQIVGVQLEPGSGGALAVDPLPAGLTYFRAEGIFLRGHRVDVLWDSADGFAVYVDGQQRAYEAALTRMEVAL